ncbi:MAG TPA: hypothetical protein VGU20_04065 [Stellaceae bacterium]|nr:hypothetical protein [Stellaceae bacterium]
MPAFRPLLVVLILAARSTLAAAPETDPRAAALAVLLPDEPTPLEERQVAVKPWPHGPEAKLLIAAALLRDQDEGQVAVGVFRETHDTLALLARSDDGEPDADEPLWNAAIGLDLIPYRISPGEVAFGVTVANNYTSTARSSSSQSLQLYRYHGKKLSPIFSTIVSRSNFDRAFADDCERKKKSRDCQDQSTEEHFVVSFSPHQTNGFFDLLLRPKGGGKAARYTWTGDKYEQARE